MLYIGDMKICVNFSIIIYGETSIIILLKKPLGPQYAALFMRCPYFRGFNCTHANVRDFKWDRAVEVSAFLRCPLIEVLL